MGPGQVLEARGSLSKERWVGIHYVQKLRDPGDQGTSGEQDILSS